MTSTLQAAVKPDGTLMCCSLPEHNEESITLKRRTIVCRNPRSFIAARRALRNARQGVLWEAFDQGKPVSRNLADELASFNI